MKEKYVKQKSSIFLFVVFWNSSNAPDMINAKDNKALTFTTEIPRNVQISQDTGHKETENFLCRFYFFMCAKFDNANNATMSYYWLTSITFPGSHSTRKKRKNSTNNERFFTEEGFILAGTIYFTILSEYLVSSFAENSRSQSSNFPKSVCSRIW